MTPAAEDAAAIEFWRAQPAYSEPPSVLASLPPLPTPSRVRVVLSKLLFLAVFIPILGLLLHVVSLRFDVPWLNMTTLWHSLSELFSQRG
jgi:hypothetical protein